MASRGKSNGDIHPSQMKPPPLQAALVSTDEVLGKEGNKENEHSKIPLPLIWEQDGKGNKGYSLRTVAHAGSGVLDYLLPRQAVEWPKALGPSPASSSFISFASWSSLAISLGIFCRKEVAVASSVRLKQFVGLTLSQISHEPSKFRAQEEMCLR